MPFRVKNNVEIPETNSKINCPLLLFSKLLVSTT